MCFCSNLHILHYHGLQSTHYTNSQHTGMWNPQIFPTGPVHCNTTILQDNHMNSKYVIQQHNARCRKSIGYRWENIVLPISYGITYYYYIASIELLYYSFILTINETSCPLLLKFLAKQSNQPIIKHQYPQIIILLMNYQNNTSETTIFSPEAGAGQRSVSEFGNQQYA